MEIKPESQAEKLEQENDKGTLIAVLDRKGCARLIEKSWADIIAWEEWNQYV